jgi:hypothetical protein
MIRKITTYCAIATCLVLLAAGCLYEYPDDTTRLEPDTVELTVALTLNIEFEMDDGEETFVQSHAGLFDDGYAIRYMVDLYETPDVAKAPPSQRVCRLTATGNAMPPNGTYRFSETVTLPATKYIALVWVDFVRADDPRDLYYLTGDLQAVTIDNSRPYRGYHVSKDAFTASVSVDLSTQQQNARFEATVPVKRPFAFYRIITTDVAEYRDTPRNEPYADVRPDTTHLQYQAWFPMGYNVYPSVPDNFDNSGIHYVYNVPETGDGDTEVELAADFVFVNGNAAFYFVDLDIRTRAGVCIKRRSGLRVDLQRNRMTVIRGAFLTGGSSGGGTGIDFDFDEEEVIWF